jgi:hypothetical protein
VIPNRGATVQKGAVKGCQVCRQILNLEHFIDVLLIGVPQIVILRVPPNFFLVQVAANQKRLKNTVLDDFILVLAAFSEFCIKMLKASMQLLGVFLFPGQFCVVITFIDSKNNLVVFSVIELGRS